MPKVPTKLYKIGKEIVEARHMGEALGLKRALVEEGKVSHMTPIVEHAPEQKLGATTVVEAPQAKNGTVRVAPGIAAMGAMPDINVNPLDALRGAGQAWQSTVVDPIAGALKNTLTPEMQVQGQTYQTASPASNFILETAADPVNYIPGGAGAIIGGAQMAAQYADGGVVKKADEQPAMMFDDLQPDTAAAPAASAAGDFDSLVDDGDNTAQKAGAFAIGAADSATLGLAGAGLNVLHKIAPETVPGAEERAKIAAAQPGYHMAGQVSGLFAPGGAGSLMTKAGEAVAAKLAAKTLSGRIGSAAARGAVENVIFASGDETAKMFMNDPHQTAESVAANLGLSAVIGGALGGTVGGVGELWDMGPGKKLKGVLSGLKAKSEGLTATEAKLAGLDLPPEIIASMEPGFAKEQGIALQQSDTFAGRNFQKNLDETYRKIEDSANEVVGHTRGSIEKLDTDAHVAGAEIRSTLEKEIKAKYEPLRQEYKAIEDKLVGTQVLPDLKAKIEQQVTELIASEGLAKAAKTAPGLLNMAKGVLEDLGSQTTAQDLRQLARNITESAPFGSEKYQIGKKLSNIIKAGQDEATASAAAKLGPDFAANFKQTQSQYRALKQQLNELNDYLRIGRPQGTESFVQNLRNKLDAKDVVSRLTKDSVELRQLLEKNFPEAAAQARRHEMDVLLEKSKTKDGTAIDVTKLEKNLGKMDPTSRAQLLNEEQLTQLSKLHDVATRLPKNDNYSGTAKALERAWGYIPSAAGGMAGLLAGDDHNVLLGVLGAAAAHQATPALRLAALRFLASDAPISARGFASMIGMAKNAAKGEAKMNQAVESVFEKAKNGTAEVKPESIEKLKKQVDAISENPELLMDIGEHVGHYMPETAAATAEAASRNVLYLSSLRPQIAPLSPLDGIRKVSQQEESDYNRALQIAENPLVVLDAVKNGSLDPKDLQHLQTMHPKSYARMQEKLNQELIKRLQQGETLPYKTQLGMSVFLKQPMASSLQPQAIMAAQPKPLPPKAPSASSMQGLQKMPTMYMTPGQANQLQKLKH